MIMNTSNLMSRNWHKYQTLILEQQKPLDSRRLHINCLNPSSKEEEQNQKELIKIRVFKIIYYIIFINQGDYQPGSQHQGTFFMVKNNGIQGCR